MARMHILRQTSLNTYEIVVHATTPAGNNLAGVAWSTAISNSGPPASTMTVGNGPGQISTSENNQVANGSVIEVGYIWQDDPNWNDTQRAADLKLRAQQAVAEAVTNLQARLRWFGRTVA